MSQRLAPVIQSNRQPGLRAWLARCVVAAGLCLLGVAQAAPLAGTSIDNTASATYFDTDRGFNSTLLSNTVRITVQAQEALTLTGANNISRAAGGIATLPHRLTNTGNTPSQYVLNFANRAGDGFDLLGLTLVHDQNGNGVADAGEPRLISGATFGPLAPGALANFVLLGELPNPAITGLVANIDFDARSLLQGLAASTQDGVTIADGAQLQLFKSASNLTPQPRDLVTFTLSASNTGNRPASGVAVTVDGLPQTLVLIRDTVPANTTFVALGAAGVAVPLYHVFGQPPQSFRQTPPADPATVDAVAFGFAADIAPNQSHVRSFDVRINSNAAGSINNTGQLLFNDGVLAQSLTVDSNLVRLAAPTLAPTLLMYGDARYTRQATVINAGQPVYVAFDASRCNLDPQRAETWQVSVASQRGGDAETYTATETSVNSGVFHIEPRVPTVSATATPAARGDGKVSVLPDDKLTASVSGCGTTRLEGSVLVDPFGIVFDSKTNAPVAGAAVTLIDVSGAGNGGRAGQPAVVFLADGVTRAPSALVTGVDGSYQFPLVAPSTYRLMVVPPASFSFPSALALNLLPPDRVVEAAGSYGGTFTISALSAPVQLDIPVDASPRSGFFIEKSASKQSVELGDFVDYQIRIKNVSGQLLGQVRVADKLPAGFAYLRGSARLDGGTTRLNGSALPEPEGGVGPALVFNIGSIEDSALLTLSYRVRVGPGALQGDGINRAMATTAGPLPKQSNESQVIVQVLPGVFSERGYLLGNVYADCNSNQQRDDGEPGIAGVRLYLEDGTHVTTDRSGRYSLYGLRPQTHVLKLDATTLPFALGVENKLALLANRQAGDAGSRFVDMKNGELQRADFAVVGCSDKLRQAIDDRARDAEKADRDVEGARDARLAADPRPVTITDPKALPASGIVGQSSASIAVPSRAPSFTDPAQIRRAQIAAAAPLSDEKIAAFDNRLRIVSPTVGQVLGYAQTGAVIKGELGATLVLRVNGVEVPASRIGRQSKVVTKQLQVLEFVGLDLLPGDNILELLQRRADGTTADRHQISVKAPGTLARLRLVVPQEGLPADGRSAVKVIIEPGDASGVPVLSPTAVTLNASHGRWLVKDLDPVEPGVQVFVEGGHLVVEFESPAQAGDVQLQATAGQIEARATLAFVPELRPLIASGIIEGVFNLRKLDSDALQPARAQDGFEQALQRVGGTAADGRSDAGARAAVFLKGKVLGSALLTLAYDSTKDTREQLFRDIQPGEFYPVYGDDSVPGFDAQSTGRLYVRLERDKSYLLYGDFSTQTVTAQRPGSVALEERRLGQYSRSLNGLRGHLETPDSRSSVTAFASQTSSRQVIDELPALGISGPYALSRAPLIANSEKVELLTRDRDQRSLIVRTQLLQRFVDYEIETLTGRILLKGPLPSLDGAFNPQSLRITYEVETGGEKAWVGGVAGRHEIDDRFAVSAGVVRDSDAQKPLTLASAGVTMKLGAETAVHAEAARTETPLGLAENGNAARIELRHDSEALKVQVQGVKAGSGFDNPSAGATAGRQEITAKGSVKLGEQTALKAEYLRNDDLASTALREGAQVALEHAVNERVRAEIGLRHSRGAELGVSAPTAAALTPTTSLRLKLSTQVPNMPRAIVFGELEQDIHDSDRQVAALGGEYRIDNASRAYARHEFISSLGSRYGLNDAQQRNATVFGVQTDYATDANLFSEYRLREGLDGREAEAALGLRNRWRLGQGWAMTTGYERVHSLGDVSATSSSESTVVALGVEYSGATDWKGASRLEVRGSRSSDTLLSTTGAAFKLDEQWTALARNTLSLMRQQGVADKTEDWLQFGLAYREAGANTRNALLRAEYRFEGSNEPLLGSSQRNAAIVSAHLNQQHGSRLLLSGRVAAKAVREAALGQTSRYHAELLSARATYDLTPLWDIGAQASTLIGDGGRSRQLGLGTEVGYRMANNLWVSGGWNAFGFSDRDLAAQDQTQRGVYLRLRWKFDERLFETTP